MSKISASALKEAEETARQIILQERLAVQAAIDAERKKQDEVQAQARIAVASSCWCGKRHETDTVWTPPRETRDFRPQESPVPSLFVSSISYQLTREEAGELLVHMCEPVKVMSVYVMHLRWHYDYQHRGMAVLNFSSVADALAAGQLLSGHQLFRNGLKIALKVDFNKRG